MEGIAMTSQMTRNTRLFHLFLVGALALGLGATGRAAEFSIARIYIEYNSTPSDLGFHVSLDGEDWKSLKIVNPNGKTIFEVAGRGAFKDLGMTELFFEGAEPALAEFPLEDLLALFPEGRYQFIGTTVDGIALHSSAMLTHAVPDGPRVSSKMDDGTVIIRWDPVTRPPAGFPVRDIEIVEYQIIVGKFLVTLPASSTSVEVPEEFFRSLESGVHVFEVLAIDASGNQTITEGSFNKTDEDKRRRVAGRAVGGKVSASFCGR